MLVCARIRELQETLSAGTIALEISSRNARVAALQKRWDRLRAGLDLILDQRGADMADLPGDASGMLVRDCKGKEAERLVTRIELARRGTPRPRAPGRRGIGAVEGAPRGAQGGRPLPAAITLAMLMTSAEFRGCWSRALEKEKSR